MNLAVPAFKMREVIQRKTDDGEFDSDVKATLQALLANKADLNVRFKKQQS